MKEQSKEQGIPEEPKLKVRAKAQITVDGIVRKTGEVFELPEREALGLVGEGQAEQVTEEQSGTGQEGQFHGGHPPHQPFQKGKHGDQS